MLKLKKREEKRIESGHLWIYSNEIDTKTTPLKNFQAGQIVTVESSSGKFLGKGYINPHNLLCVRILTKNATETIDVPFFQKRILDALHLRERYFKGNFYRLIYGESDGIPGLIVDRYDGILVAQFTTFGIENLKDTIIEALVNALKPKAILLKNDTSSRNFENLPLYVEAAFDNPPKIIQLKEQDIVFDVPIWEGQKTGWFFDQKQNRSLLGKYVKDSRVLDVFSYIGAWGISAAVFGAREVLCVDSSKSAIELATKNAENNNVQNIVRTLNLDAFAALKQLNKNKEIFDTIIIDPPAFIKKQKDIKEGCNAYLRIHMLALQLLKSHGILFTTSCSQHFTKEMFLEILQKAATTCKRELLILEQLHQSLDHPIHPSIPETEYLKGFVIMAK